VLISKIHEVAATNANTTHWKSLLENTIEVSHLTIAAEIEQQSFPSKSDAGRITRDKEKGGKIGY